MRGGTKFIKGLFYFPLMTNIMDDDKIKVLIATHGRDAFSFLIMMWASTYKNDYFKVWGTREKKIFCNDYGFDIQLVDDILDTCLEEDLFDKDLYKKYQILTSKRIQNTWIEVTSRRVKISFRKEYFLLDREEQSKFYRIEITDINERVLIPATTESPKPRDKKPKEDKAAVNVIKQFTYDDVNRYISIDYNDRDKQFKADYDEDVYNEYILINRKINERYDGIRKSTRQLTFPQYIEFKDVMSPTPSALEIENAFKKMASLGIKAESDIYLRLEECLGMIRKPFIKPVTPQLIPDLNSIPYHRDNELENSMMSFWGFNEINNPDRLQAIVAFITVLNNTGKLDVFKRQFPYYKEYKTMTGIKFRHSLITFIGSQENRYTDAKWLTENWEQILKEEKNKPSKSNGRKENTRGATPEHGYGSPN